MNSTLYNNIFPSDTASQYAAVVHECRDLFEKKVQDYGTSWRVLRTISIVDQLYIKAWRIRQIQEQGKQRVSDSIESEFIGIVNYGIIALIQQSLPADERLELTSEEASEAYQREAGAVEQLMQQKNFDYGEAWRQMSQQSFTDLILVKLARIREIVQNEGRTIVSEGIDANFVDIVNYAIFALIKINETKHSSND